MLIVDEVQVHREEIGRVVSKSGTKEERRGRTAQRPVLASNGQNWRAIISQHCG